MIRLTPLDDSQPIILTQEIVLVGRSREACDLAIDDTSISKMHCVLSVASDGLLVRDLNSTNGVFLGGQRVKNGKAYHGDVLYLAQVPYRVEVIKEGSEVKSDSGTVFLEEPPTSPLSTKKSRPRGRQLQDGIDVSDSYVGDVEINLGDDESEWTVE